MKKTNQRFSTQRWNDIPFTPGTQEDDFKLADLNTIPDDENIAIEPITTRFTDDEDAIDRLLANSGFDSNTLTESKQVFANSSETLSFIEPDLPSTSQIFEENHISDNFNEPCATPESEDPIVEPVDLIQENNNLSNTDRDNFEVNTFIVDYFTTRKPESLSLNDNVEINENRISANHDSTQTSPLPNKSDIADNFNLIDESLRPNTGDVPQDILATDPSYNDDRLTFDNRLIEIQQQVIRLNKKMTIITVLSTSLFICIMLFAIGMTYLKLVEIKTEITKQNEWLELIKEDITAFTADR